MSEEVEGQVETQESDATSRDYVIESDVTSQELDRTGCLKNIKLVKT